jgi:hypothetical protein
MILRAIFLIGSLLSGSRAGAQTTGTESVPFPPGSFLLGAIALLVVFACLLAAFKVYSAIRGGKLGRGWVWLLLGFATLGGAQLLLFIGQVGIIPLWPVWVDALRLVSLLLLLVGVSQIRKLLA